MLNISCSAATTTNSSMGQNDCAPSMIPSFTYMDRSRVSLFAFQLLLSFAFQSSDGGAIMPLAPPSCDSI